MKRALTFNAGRTGSGFKVALLASAGTAAMLLANPAYAQETAPATPAATPGADTSVPVARSNEEIVVTGSRIARKDFNSNSPIVTVGTDLLQNTGTSAVEQDLNKLPEFSPDKTPTGLNSGDIQATPTNTPGSATVSLRGIGSNRNLVLIDGRRATPANASMAVDINTIPSSMIDRVEIISGGASSTYGADAVGGVVNFILKHNFKGLQLDGETSISQYGDGLEYKISGLLGTDFADGRGNITLSMETNDRAKSLAFDRPYTRAQNANPTIGGNYFFPTYPALIADGTVSQAAINGLFPGSTPGSVTPFTTIYFTGNTPFTFGTGSANNGGVGNFPASMVDGQVVKRDEYGNLSENFPDAYLYLPLNRFNFYSRGHFDINDWVSVIAQGYFNKTHTETVQQPGPIVGGWNVVIPRYADDATYLPSSLVTLLNSRANPNAPWQVQAYVPGLGDRYVTSDVYTYNMVAGFEGKIPGSDWTWDITGNQGESFTYAVTTGVASLARLRAVMGADDFGANTTFTGNATGGGFGASNATCTSGLNPFSTAAVSADCITAVNADLKESGDMQQTIWEANAQGGLFNLPAGRVKASVGATYRRNKYTFLEDTLKTSGESFNDQALGIYPSDNIRATLTSKEVYGELSVPLLSDLPMIKMLELDGGIRYADSSQTGGSTTWKLEGNWEMTNWFRLSATYNKAVRAPNLGELYSFTQTFGLLTGGDACSTGNPYSYSANPKTNPNAAAVQQLCRELMDKTSIPGQPKNSDTFYGNSGLGIPVSPGAVTTSTAPGFAFPYYIGNPNLKPEQAKTLTISGTLTSPFESPWAQRLRLRVDYYNISVTDAIGLQSGQTLQQLCLDKTFNPTYDPNSFYCNNFARGTGGGIGAVSLAYVNTAAFKTAGLDVQLDWNIPLKDTVGLPGSFGINSVYSYLFTLKSSPFYSGVPTNEQTPFTEYAGTFAAPDAGLNATGNYRWKVLTTFTYSLKAVNLGLQWQHLPAIASGSTNTGYGAYNLFNLNAGVAVTPAVSMRFGVDNLFNTWPPFGNASTTVNTPDQVALQSLPGGGYDTSGVYDTFGRRFWFGITAKF